MISALVPTRGRPQALAESIASLLDLADDPGGVEVLAAIDPDEDLAAIVAALGGQAPPGLAWRAPERFGYTRIHDYYNELAERAAGEWLLIWNDDAVMRTPGWDRVIEAQEPAVLWPSANHHRELCLFPAWPAAWTRATGRVSLCFNADTWMQEVGESLGRLRKIPVDIFHDRDNVTHSGRFADATAAEGTLRSDQTCSVFRSAEMVAARERDAGIIRGLL